MKDINKKAGQIFGCVLIAGAVLTWIYAAYEYGLSVGYEKGHDFGKRLGRIDGLTEALMKSVNHEKVIL